MKRWYKLSFNEFVTLLLSGASVILALLAYLQSQDNRDMRDAISHIARLSQEASRQADAAHKQLSELGKQTKEMEGQTQALTSTAQSTTSMAGTTVAQLRQRDRQFALEQQPDVRWDAESTASRENFFSDDKRKGVVFWSFGFKNFGKSPAYDLTYIEGISLFGKPFQETKRNSNSFLGRERRGGVRQFIE